VSRCRVGRGLASVWINSGDNGERNKEAAGMSRRPLGLRSEVW
jgi:hypothetical protein